MRSLHWLLIASVGSLASSPPPIFIQPSTVVIRVVDELSRRGLSNADVTDVATGQHRLTDERGEARLTWPTNGVLHVRVREIGYTPIERTLRPSTPGDASTFELKRVAYVISPVQSASKCSTDADSVSRLVSVSALEQLQQEAQKYAEFKRAYPFDAKIERRTARVPERGDIKRIISEKESVKSDALDEPYRPGAIVKYWRGGFDLPILVLSTLADSAFWDNHCYIARGVEPYQGARVLRLEFSPSSNLRGPDWQGAALLDSASSLLVRVEFSIANLDPDNIPRRLEGYTTFTSPSPFVVIPDTTFAQWWLSKRGDAGEWGKPDYLQSLQVQEILYKKAKPPTNAGEPGPRQ